MTRHDETVPRPSWWVRMLAALPLGMLHGLSRAFAWLAWRVFPYQPRVIRDSLALAFPERSDAEREALRRDFYRGYGDVMVEIIKSASIDGRELDTRMRLGNLELLQAALAHGTPVVLLAAHQCNWEWILLALSRNLGYPVDAAYKPLKNAWADREMRALRSRFGARMVPADRMMRELIARRRVPRLIALVADQEPVASERRHWTRFLNRETAFFMGADVIATSLDYPVFFVAIERAGRGRYLASFELLRAAGEVLPPGALTERYARRVERQIHAAPADWPWSHKRWRLRRP
ncbi:MAG: lysophospholipid acyltransferase family protein [Gammaproteobacteria bacterium]|nr:lysophospholipid acyltransferase family protein [Gammaproteobacteria bacterium]